MNFQRRGYRQSNVLKVIYDNAKTQHQNCHVKGVVAVMEKVKTIRIAGLIVAPESRYVLKDGKELGLSCLEFDTLLYLIRNIDLVLSKEQIYEAVWKRDTKDYMNAVTCVIYKLRQKIEPDPSHPKYLRTVRGVGYRLSSL